jgi:hypothetical protein
MIKLKIFLNFATQHPKLVYPIQQSSCSMDYLILRTGLFPYLAVLKPPNTLSSFKMGSAGGKNLNQLFGFSYLPAGPRRPHFVRTWGVWWIDGEMVKSTNFHFSPLLLQIQQ